MMKHDLKHGRIAFITTPRFRTFSPEVVKDFVYSHLYKICTPFNVMTTGRTGRLLTDIVNISPDDPCIKKIMASMGIDYLRKQDIDRWRETILDSFEITMDGFQGMIHVTYELVEGRLDAVIHLTDWEDKSGKPDSAVLSREANVHNVPIATDLNTALAYMRSWKKRLASSSDDDKFFLRRHSPSDPPLAGLKKGDRVLAMVAHDNMKLETCRFAVEQQKDIFHNYDYILATGTTGAWLKRFMEAAGRMPSEVEKIRCCNSGPRGGDIQIAYAVVRGICTKVVFLQDPSVSHPHDSDIRLFEQAVLGKGLDVQIATNVESARLLIGA